MPSIEDLSIVDSNTAKAKKVGHGLTLLTCIRWNPCPQKR